MNLAEMHVWFRQYAQQMGMQNTRMILPEQIDMLINTSITDIVNDIIKNNIANTNDRVITDNTKLGQINSLSTLYKVRTIKLVPTNSFMNQAQFISYSTSPVKFNKGLISLGELTQGSESLTDSQKKQLCIPDKEDSMFIYDFSINYKKVERDWGMNSFDDASEYKAPSFDNESFETNYFPVRLIDDAYLADALNDFILKPRLRSPVIVNHDGIYDLYIEPFQKAALIDDEDLGEMQTYTLFNGLVPYELRVSYLAKPAKVRYVADLQDKNVDCDLPEFMHIPILKHAVDLYRIAISGSLHAAQQQEQAQQQENVRNNYRNEGTQR